MSKNFIKKILSLIKPEKEVETKNEDNSFDMLRETQDYKDEVRLAGGFDIDCPEMGKRAKELNKRKNKLKNKGRKEL